MHHLSSQVVFVHFSEPCIMLLLIWGLVALPSEKVLGCGNQKTCFSCCDLDKFDEQLLELST